MTAIDLRKHIIQKLQEIDDLSFLEAVKTIIDSKVEKEVFYINDEMLKELLHRKDAINSGNFIDNDALFKEVDQWLKEK